MRKSIKRTINANDGVAVMGVVGFAGLWWLPRLGLFVLLMAGMLAIFVGSAREFHMLWRASRRWGARQWRRWLGAVSTHRSILAVHPVVATAWYLATYLVIASLLLFAWLQSDFTWGLSNAAMAIMMVVATVDFGYIAARFARWAWSHPSGKLVMGSISAVVATNALSWASAVVWALTHEEPAKAPASVAFFTVILGALAWVNVVACVSTLVALPMMGGILAKGPTDQRSHRPRSMVRKLIRGLRPTLLCIAPLVALLTFTAGALPHNRWVQAAGVLIVVHLDYHQTEGCDARVKRANRIDDRSVSAAWTLDGWPHVETIACPKPEPATLERKAATK